MIKLGEKNIEPKGIEKCILGNKIIWENWKIFTGYLLQMNVNSWRGFNISVVDNTGFGSDFYKACDGNINTSWGSGYSTAGIFKIDFPKAIKIKKIYINLNTAREKRTIYYVNTNGNEVELQDIPNGITNIDTDIIAKGLILKTAGSNTTMLLNEFNVTEWYEKN